MNSIKNIEFYPLTPERWEDFVRLFGKNGACGGCWCMWWRLSRAQYERQKGEGNRHAMQNLVNSGTVPGIIAYLEGNPVGWCSVAPREDYPHMAGSKVMKSIDEQPVWSVACLFVDRKYRRRGLSVGLIRHAVTYVKERGGHILEAYPVEPKKQTVPGVFVYTGLASAFRAAGFKEVARRAETRPLMRYYIRP
jgi:GNAT superfamily N-acetyltransferase